MLIGITMSAIVIFNTTKASLITFTYEGSVNSIGASGYQVPSFNIGEPFQVSFTFDSAAPNVGGLPTVGNYYALTSLSFTIGSYSGSLSGSFPPINVADDYTGQGAPQDYYNIIATGSTVQGPAVSGWVPTQFVFQLVDPTVTAFNSIALPLAPPNPADFVSPNTYIGLTFESPSGGYSEVLTQNLSPVPEPGMPLLSGIGFVLYLVLRKVRTPRHCG